MVVEEEFLVLLDCRGDKVVWEEIIEFFMWVVVLLVYWLVYNMC